MARTCTTMPDTTGLPMSLFHAVRGTLPMKIMPPHHTGEAPAFACASDIDQLDVSQRLDRDLLANFIARRVAAKLANTTLRLTASLRARHLTTRSKLLRPLTTQLCNVTTFATTCKATGLIFKTQLDRLIAITLGCPNLKYIAWTSSN